MHFLETFDSTWAMRLGPRRHTFRQLFEFLLARKAQGHFILETGCAREADNWEGDGQSTIMFDRFAREHGGEVVTVDLDETACAYARGAVSPCTTVHHGDSVRFLHGMAGQLLRAGRAIDLLYLDSFDLDPSNPAPSALHHLKELCAIAPALGDSTLVVVDDAYHQLRGFRNERDEFVLLEDQGIAGKARFVAEYFAQVGIRPLFDGYQCGWVVP